MSLSTTGVWAVGAWATTPWADGVWYEGGSTPAPEVVVTRPPRPSDNERRRKIFKPTGLVDRPARPTIKDRIDDSSEIEREVVSERLLREFQQSAPPEIALYPPVELMSQQAIDRERGERLRKIAAMRAAEDEDFLIMMATIL